jgi:hypothetical protein
LRSSIDRHKEIAHAVEGSDEATREKYRRDALAEYLEIAAIEQAFATAIGPEAVSELARVKSAKHDAFDPTGRKPMASYNWFAEMDAIRRPEEKEKQRRKKERLKDKERQLPLRWK